ncbi:MAG: GNAT family N-acetyltransferase [Candidatus Eremiobacteraeota bacterium]|nr:GNAT family N-acetyltransferase [Candidatus Eremiobacteraeota bacterium]
MTIRRARLNDRDALAALAFRSKAHWGYDDSFMERSRDALTPSDAYLANDPVFVAVDEHGTAIGFYGFVREGHELWLNDLFIDPAAIRTGAGRTLFAHAAETAHAAGAAAFFIESDPNAEGFYLAMGAARAGERVAASSGRVLPVLRYDLRTRSRPAASP